MNLSGKRILIIGGTGSLGKALIRRLASSNELCIVSRDEAKHWTIKNNLAKGLEVDFVVADIRDKSRIKGVIKEKQPQVIILAAALKQVDTCERYPYESVQTNLIGINNVIETVLELENEVFSIETVLMVSTDKACAPTNVYGMSKAISERIVTSAKSISGRIKFVGVRYGNVLESRGSIIPLFRLQAERGANLTITDPNMTRFIMTLDQSIDLIEAAIMGANSQEIWLPKLSSMRILDLAEIFASKYSVKTEIIGIRPGEKIHEELISEPESLRIKDEGRFLILGPTLSGHLKRDKLSNYSSRDNLLEKEKLETYLSALGIFIKPLASFIGREIEEISIPRSDK